MWDELRDPVGDLKGHIGLLFDDNVESHHRLGRVIIVMNSLMLFPQDHRDLLLGYP